MKEVQHLISFSSPDYCSMTMERKQTVWLGIAPENFAETKRNLRITSSLASSFSQLANRSEVGIDRCLIAAVPIDLAIDGFAAFLDWVC